MLNIPEHDLVGLDELARHGLTARRRPHDLLGIDAGVRSAHAGRTTTSSSCPSTASRSLSATSTSPRPSVRIPPRRGTSAPRPRRGVRLGAGERRAFGGHRVENMTIFGRVPAGVQGMDAPPRAQQQLALFHRAIVKQTNCEQCHRTRPSRPPCARRSARPRGEPTPRSTTSRPGGSWPRSSRCSAVPVGAVPRALGPVVDGVHAPRHRFEPDARRCPTSVTC